MALYGLGQYGGLILISLALYAIVPDMSPRRLFRAGIVLTVIFYIVLIALGRKVGALALPLGLFNGAAIGTYWFGNNTLAYDMLEAKERSNFYGLTFGIMSALNVVMPLSAGFVIARVGGAIGYKVVFGVAAFAFVFAWWTARRLHATTGVGGTPLKEAIFRPMLRSSWAKMWVAVSLRSFNQVVQSTSVLLLVVIATHSSVSQGEIAAAAGVASAGASVMAGRIPLRWRTRGMWAGAICEVIAPLVLIANHSFVFILIYGIFNGLVYPILFVPLSSVVLDVMDDDPDAERLRGGYVLSREVSTNAGRIAGLGLLLVFLAQFSAVDAILAAVSVGAILQLVVARLATSVQVASSQDVELNMSGQL